VAKSAGTTNSPNTCSTIIENQIWYEDLSDGTLRTGFTPWAVALMGDVLVFTPKRLGHAFEKERWFAMVEGGKWVGAAARGFRRDCDGAQ